MITWMQKHRKYLVVTIWISTIAFVGAGFVGWGSYEYGKQSGSVAVVGDVSISVQALNRTYSNLYEQYNRMLGGRLDQATAKQFGLEKQALQTLIYQALLENYANDNGVIVTEEEIQQEILSINAFYKEGRFDRTTYLSVLQNMHFKPKDFEAQLADDLLARKVLDLFDYPLQNLEEESLAASMLMEDRIRYRVLNQADVTVDLDEKAIESYWKNHKADYLTPRKFEVALVAVEPEQKAVPDTDLKAYYDAHKTQFVDASSKILSFEESKDAVSQALAQKTAKKEAQRAYIDLKKEASDRQPVLYTFNDGESPLGAELTAAVKAATPGELIKPKPFKEGFAVARLQKIIEPAEMSYARAKALVSADWLAEETKAKLLEHAEAALPGLAKLKPSAFISRTSVDKLTDLDETEASQFLKKLFASQAGKGVVDLGDKVVVYAVAEQRLLDNEKFKEERLAIGEQGVQLKKRLIQDALVSRLQQRYPVKIYMKEAM